MGRTVEIKLNDAQYAALSAEVEASGQRFYDYCRNKLMAGIALPTAVRKTAVRDAHNAPMDDMRCKPEPEPDRIASLEAKFDQLMRALARPDATLVTDQRGQILNEEFSEIDVDGMVERSLADAEQQGLTQRVYSEADQEMAIVGVRAVGPRRAPPYSPGTQPQHLR